MLENANRNGKIRATSTAESGSSQTGITTESNVSVIIITLNEERDIERSLESVSWSDDIVVVDSYSEDSTVEIARRYTEKVFLREFSGFSDQRQFAASQCSNDWVLSIDADEVISGELCEEIKERLASGGHDAYHIPIATLMFGGWLKHGNWYPNYHIRLYRRSRAEWGGFVHEKIVVHGSCGYLKRPILHYHNNTISSYISNTDKYTDLDVSNTTQLPDNILFRLTLRPLYSFIKNFILQGGILDGVRGFIVCCMRAGYEFVLAAKLWNKFNNQGEVPSPPSYRVTLRVRLTRLAFSMLNKRN